MRKEAAHVTPDKGSLKKGGQIGALGRPNSGQGDMAPEVTWLRII
jgi:hypothetical protein